MTMDEQWIQEMRQKMADYQWPAPEVSWDELDQALATGVTHQTHLLWLRRMAAAAVILLIAGIGYWGLLHNDAEPMQPTTASVSNQPQDENYGDGSRDLANSQYHGPVPVILAKPTHTPKITSTPVIKSETASPISTVTPDTVKTPNTTAATEKEQPHPVEEKERPTKEILPVIYPSDLHQRKRLDNRLTAKVYVTSAMTGNQTESYGKPDVYIIGVLSRYPNYPNSSYSNLAVLTEHYVHHRQPVRFGLSLRYRLTDCWSVESGLTYTRLSTDITTIILNKTTVTEQRLNYIGLPLNISYELWKSRFFGLYVTGGGTIEKCLDANPWQFSLNGAAGAEYKLTNFFSLYAEPGIGYYFKDGSSTPTIYKDHPLNFYLSFGLRFNLK